MKQFKGKGHVTGYFLILFLSLTFFANTAPAQKGKDASKSFNTVSKKLAEEKGCLSCHEGIEPIREEGSVMQAMVDAMGGCVVCHGGTPNATSKEKAHSGAPDEIPVEDFYPDPGSIWIADKTCGSAPCHRDKPYQLHRALMQTEAGKIQGNLWAWGMGTADRKVRYGNYDIEDTDGPVPRVGSEVYKKYMANLIANNPSVFPRNLEQLPAVDDPKKVEENPALAAITYQRHECQRCHVGVRGREKRGDWRGMGCSACHILYSNDGFYEGNDPTIPKDQPGHMLKHRIRGSRKAGGGIPVEVCNSCHNRGKRIGMTYQGLMEFPYGSPFTEEGGTQPKLHTKRYLYIREDLHHRLESRPENPKGRLFCQDCHTSIDMHGDGNIPGTTLAQVEIECQDCHGTPDKYPWQLPIGYGEEFGKETLSAPRGTTKNLLPFQAMAKAYPSEDGYLLTARGNPFGNVVRRGDKAVLHSAAGKDFFIPLLKKLQLTKTWKSPNAEVAMSTVSRHMERLECYACHANWAPQCYGCHVKVDYSKDKKGTDWILTGNKRGPDGRTAEAALGVDGVKSPGEVTELRGYLRWEEPILGINGEGRVSPLVPGCQVVTTVIGPDGKTIVRNKIWRTPPNTEGGGSEGQRGLDMAPLQPHSTLLKARRCESCHSNPKALGYGMEDGIYQARYTENIVVDLETGDGEIIPQNTSVQITAVPDLMMDWSRIVTREGEQLQTVGSHWPLSRPLNNEERAVMERTGVCMGCHKEMADVEFWKSVSTPDRLDNAEHDEHMNLILKKGGNRN